MPREFHQEDHSRYLHDGRYFASKRLLFELGAKINPLWQRYPFAEYYYVPGEEWRKLVHEVPA